MPSSCDVSRAIASAIARMGSGPLVDTELTENDRDGRRWLLQATDDGARFEWVEAEVARLRSVEIPEYAVAAAVEQRASNMPCETRLADLVARSPIVLRVDELFPGES